jgi:hypothetical protein
MVVCVYDTLGPEPWTVEALQFKRVGDSRMREDQIDQAERRETLDNDLKVLRERGGTFFQHGLAQANDMAGGRFAAIGASSVTGSTPIPQYPAAAALSAIRSAPNRRLAIRLTNPNPRRCLASRTLVLQQARLRPWKISLHHKTNPATLEHLLLQLKGANKWRRSVSRSPILRQRCGRT